MLLTCLRNAVRSKGAELKNFLVDKSQTSVPRALRKCLKMANTSIEPTQANSKQKSTKANSKQTLQKERQQQNKPKNISYIPGTVTLQILGTGSNGGPAAVYLFTDQSRYLFNCGEGTQRLAHEHKTKLSRLEQIFVTRNTWPTIGGFPGLALTVQDAGVKELTLHGPPCLDNILYSMKSFVVLKNLMLKTVDCTQTDFFEDSVMSVKCIPLYYVPNHKEIQNSLTKSSSEEQIAITYICTLKPRPGALNLEKCVEHGVPPGPLLGLLKNGIDVTLDNGTVVKSKDVSEPNENPLSFMFLDIPSLEFLPNLDKHKDILVNTKINADNSPEMPLVVHFSPQEVVDNNLYQTFIEQFLARTQHIYLNCKQNTFSGYIAAHRLQYHLNILNPRVFPLLSEASSLTANLSSKLKKTKLEDDRVNGETEPKVATNSKSLEYDKNLKDLNAMTYYHFRPKKGLDRTLEAKLSPSEYIQETQLLQDLPPLLEKLKNDFKHKEYSLETSLEYPVITFLGTGSCVPNKTRNVSSILIQPCKDSFMLFDCGEGTLGQIQRFFGSKKAENVVKNLKCIYVSHLHADHHIGLIGLLTNRLQLVDGEKDSDKVILLAPKQIEPWLNFYDEHIFNIRNSYKLIGNAELLEEPLSFGTESIKTCLVKHCPHSFGVSLKIIDPKQPDKPVKITYSGDTMPCQDLIDLGLDSTILIHEATMEDDLVEEARFKTHSTISQAIQQGRLMNAQYTILTHFSQRYAKLPRLQFNFSSNSNGFAVGERENSSTNDMKLMENVAIAFDNMQVSLRDLDKFHLMYPAMRSLFAEHAEELEQKALKRELKLERKRKLLSS